MANHDYIIDNQTFPATRTDLNNALSAIVSNNSSSSEPSTTYAYQWWYDTTTTTLKFRNRDNDAWVGFATFDMDNDTVNFLDSTVTITGLATTATGTSFTLSDTDNKTSVDFIIDNEKKVKFREATSNGTNSISLKAPATLTSDVTFTLPNADGSADEVIKTDGSGNLSFGEAGRTGTVNWCTTAKTSPFTAVSGDGYFVNTTSGSVTVTLPSSPSAGDIVAFKDYANTWDTNNLTVGRNSSKINGECANATLNTESQSVTLIYVDGTKGWQDIHDSTSNVTGESFITATGGTETTCGNYKIHTFTSDGTFTVNQTAGSAPNNEVSYLVVAGGGGSSFGGGGAGGFRESKSGVDCYSASPIEGSTNITVTAQAYPITVGGGGAGATIPGTAVAGSNSVFSTVTSAGGGLGATLDATGGNGGSGGGGGGGSGPFAGGTGNTPPTSPAQGFDGGIGGNTPPNNAGGGGGGATATGGTTTTTASGNGGAGATTSISGSSVGRAGGGGGGARNHPSHTGGTASDGGGAGKPYSPGNGTSGTANTGGGGGGAGSEDLGGTGGAGGSGVVIIRYKFQ